MGEQNSEENKISLLFPRMFPLLVLVVFVQHKILLDSSPNGRLKFPDPVGPA